MGERCFGLEVVAAVLKQRGLITPAFAEKLQRIDYVFGVMRYIDNARAGYMMDELSFALDGSGARFHSSQRQRA